MAGANQIPKRLVNFNVYTENNALAGVADVTLPVITPMTDTVSGAGIAGEVESTVLGHYSSMTVTIKWRTITKEAIGLAAQKAHQIDLRGSQQVYDAANGVYTTTPVRLALRVVPKALTLGTFTPGTATGTEQEFEVLYLKLYVGGKEAVEIDKFNYVAKFGDTDLFALSFCCGDFLPVCDLSAVLSGTVVFL